MIVRSWRFLRSCLLALLLVVPSSCELSHYFDPKHDKFATEDVFYQVAEAGELTAHKPPVNLTEVSDTVRNCTVTVYVEVKLLGFSWKAEGQPVIEPSTLSDFLDIIRRDRGIHVAKPYHYRLASSKKIIFHVSKEFEDRFRGTLEALHLAGKTRIHYRIIDDLLSEDFESSPTSAFTIYLLAFPDILNSRMKPYWYSLNPESGCGTTVWAGKERYVWIDLSAGPVEMATLKDNSNSINQWTLPRLEHYGTPSDFRDVEFTSSVASLVNQVVEQQIFPSYQSLPLYTDSRQLVLQLIVITDELSTINTDSMLTRSINWPLFRDTIGGLALYGQKLSYKVTSLILESCSHCVAAFSHALATKVEALKQNGSAVVTHQYLDSTELHHWLAQFRESFGLPTLPELSQPPFKTSFTFPIFLFDLFGYHSLLLDDSKQAVSFEDMVIAIRTPFSWKAAGFQCTGNTPEFDTSDVTRPVLASLLESLYGLLPTESFINIAKNESQMNLLWTAGLTPFSYLSSSQEMSFALREAALRAPIFGGVDKNLRIVQEALDHYQVFGVDLCSALSTLECRQFTMRWELLQYKLAQTISLLSVGNYQHSLYFSRSLRFEAAAMKFLLSEAEKSVYPRLRCEGVPLTVWSLPGVVTVSCVCVLGVLLAAGIKVVINKTGVTAGRTRDKKTKVV